MSAAQDGPERHWFPLDVAYFEQSSVREIGRALGPGGQLGLVWIIAAAHRQHNAGGQGGNVSAYYASVASELWMTIEDARQIVAECVRIGVLTGVSDEGAYFEGQLTKWDRWQLKRPTTGAARQARHRSSRATLAKDAVAAFTGGAVTPEMGVETAEQSAIAGGPVTAGDDRNGSRGEKRKEEERTNPFSGDTVRLTRLLADRILERDPKSTAKGWPTPTWLDPMRLLIERDERPVEEIEHVIRWSQADPFWQKNIRSTDKLRTQYEQLREKAGPSPETARHTAAEERSAWDARNLKGTTR